MLRTARFGLLIGHNNAGREFALDAGAEKALTEAEERGWTIIRHQNDFKVMFDCNVTNSAKDGRASQPPCRAWPLPRRPPRSVPVENRCQGHPFQRLESSATRT